MAPSDSFASSISIITKPPASESGRETKASTASRQLRKAAWKSRKAAMPAPMATPMTRPLPTSSAVLSCSTSAWYSIGKSTLASSASMSAATSDTPRPLTAVTTSSRRDTASRWTLDGASAIRTSATWPSLT